MKHYGRWRENRSSTTKVLRPSAYKRLGDVYLKAEPNTDRIRSVDESLWTVVAKNLWDVSKDAITEALRRKFHGQSRFLKEAVQGGSTGPRVLTRRDFKQSFRKADSYGMGAMEALAVAMLKSTGPGKDLDLHRATLPFKHVFSIQRYRRLLTLLPHGDTLKLTPGAYDIIDSAVFVMLLKIEYALTHGGSDADALTYAFRYSIPALGNAIEHSTTTSVKVLHVPKLKDFKHVTDMHAAAIEGTVLSVFKTAIDKAGRNQLGAITESHVKNALKSLGISVVVPRDAHADFGKFLKWYASLRRDERKTL